MRFDEVIADIKKELTVEKDTLTIDGNTYDYWISLGNSIEAIVKVERDDTEHVNYICFYEGKVCAQGTISILGFITALKTIQNHVKGKV